MLKALRSLFGGNRPRKGESFKALERSAPVDVDHAVDILSSYPGRGQQLAQAFIHRQSKGKS